MITNSKIAHGDFLGAQMSTMANLVYLSKENNQDICFYREYKNFRRRFLILENFNVPKQMNGGGRIKLIRRLFLPIPEIYCLHFKSKKKNNCVPINNSNLKYLIDLCFYRLFRLFYFDFKVINEKQGVYNNLHCDQSLLNLESKKNYDIHSGYGTYQDWKKYTNVILDIYQFKNEIRKEGNEIYKALKTSKPTVAIHFRKGDYLILASLNLSIDYYKKALEYFEKDSYELVVFSDDIESCKDSEIFKGYTVHYMENHSAGVDMYLMSICDNNIIANSTFSFWGAFLNTNERKKVICPHDYSGKTDIEHLYFNGNWYPEDWIAL